MSALKDSDAFGNRMKALEAVETGRKLDVHLPIYARIDGRAFSRFTRGMEKPFDLRLIEAMIETTRHLVRETHARIGYTQSDEISLVWLADGDNSDIFFSGKVQKMVSVLASMAAAKFARVCPEGFEARLPHFDARLFQMPSKDEAANAFLWRAMDAKKNAIQMVAQSLYSAKQLHGQDQKAMLGMIADKGTRFASFPASCRLGTFLQRKVVNRRLSADELAAIPEAHRPTGPVMRTVVEGVDMPQFNNVTNRAGIIFDAEAPTCRIAEAA